MLSLPSELMKTAVPLEEVAPKIFAHEAAVMGVLITNVRTHDNNVTGRCVPKIGIISIRRRIDRLRSLSKNENHESSAMRMRVDREG